MIRGLYTSASGMITQKQRMDVVTNNLANATTPGFKQDSLISSAYSQIPVAIMENPSSVNSSNIIGAHSYGIHIDEVVTSFESGNFEKTDLKTDLAISGDGFFVTQTPEGNEYTKSGTFAVSEEGLLVTQSGYPVLGENGPINVGGKDFSIDEMGNVSSQNGNYKLSVVTFEELNGLRKQGNNSYVAFNQEPIQAQNYQVKQGFIETSNVDLVKQMVDMIEIQRSFEINQRMVKIQDERLGKAVNDIGRI